MMFTNFAALLLAVCNLQQLTKAVAAQDQQGINGVLKPDEVEFRGGVAVENGWLKFSANPITHTVYYIYNVKQFHWKAYDTGKTTDDGYKAFKMFLIGPDWYEQRKTCWQPASICLDNNFSDQVNQETIESTSEQSTSFTVGFSVSEQFEVNEIFLKESLTVSAEVSSTWSKSTSFSQSVQCNVSPKDKVQTLAQLPYTYIEGYYVDAECWHYDDHNADNDYDCWTKLDENNNPIIGYGNFTIPVNNPKMVTMTCASKSKFGKKNLQLPCDSGATEVCIGEADVDTLLEKPVSVSEMTSSTK